jgi:hypothetical protein
VTNRGYARSPVNVHPDVALVRPQRLTCVDPNANPNRSSCELALSVGGRSDCIARTGEGNKERVTLRVDLGAPVLGESLSQDSAVVGEDGCVVITEVVEQLRRALDVGEEEGDGPGGQLGHTGLSESRRRVSV